MATTQKVEEKNDEFQFVQVAPEDMPKRTRESKYTNMIERFANMTKSGDSLEVKHSDGTPLTEDESAAMYRGITSTIRYRKAHGFGDSGVKASRLSGRLFLRNVS